MGRLALSKPAMGSAWLAMSMTIGANMCRGCTISGSWWFDGNFMVISW